VDVDPAMVALTSEATAGMLNVRVVLADALAGKNTMNPAMLNHVRAGLAVAPSKQLKLVANLPYHVATPVISNMLVHPEFCPAKMVVTIQLELADRLLAEPEAEAYGSLSVLMQALADCALVRALPPSVFWPRPKVDSAVVAITPNAEKRAAVGDVSWFQSLVRQVFLHRRKNLRRVLHGFYRDLLSKPDVDALLESIGLTGMVRAEAMNVEEFLALASALRKRLKRDPETETSNV
jgi:16S rRNA (adenine1518-N6/adenine1519-N6)-dimethyltransferase